MLPMSLCQMVCVLNLKAHLRSPYDFVSRYVECQSTVPLSTFESERSEIPIVFCCFFCVVGQGIALGQL